MIPDEGRPWFRPISVEDAINVAGMIAAGTPDHPAILAYIRWREINQDELAKVFERAEKLQIAFGEWIARSRSARRGETEGTG